MYPLSSPLTLRISGQDLNPILLMACAVLALPGLLALASQDANIALTARLTALRHAIAIARFTYAQVAHAETMRLREQCIDLSTWHIGKDN
jgi:hypothetical protein